MAIAMQPSTASAFARFPRSASIASCRPSGTGTPYACPSGRDSASGRRSAPRAAPERLRLQGLEPICRVAMANTSLQSGNAMKSSIKAENCIYDQSISRNEVSLVPARPEGLLLDRICLLGGGFVQRQPAQIQLLRDHYELRKTEGLSQEALGAQVIARQNAFLVAIGSQHYDRNPGGARLGPQATQKRETVYLRQLKIEQNHLRYRFRLLSGASTRAEQVVERLDAVANDDDFVQNIVLLEKIG